jgi:calcineurin-like phosphoesterase family protein
MQVWFTADTHLGHGNIIKYCGRPFLSPEEEAAVRAERREAAGDKQSKVRLSAETVRRHDEALLDAINTRVAADDVLWVVGDFCWGGLTEALAYRNRIRCRNVFLVWGNHDRRDVRPAFTDAIEQGMIEVAGQEIWLNHYPMRSWNKAFHGSWHVYGHVHGRLRREDEMNPRALVKDVGVDACDYRPWSFDDLREYMAPRVEAFNKNKGASRDGAGDAPPG